MLLSCVNKQMLKLNIASGRECRRPLILVPGLCGRAHTEMDKCKFLVGPAIVDDHVCRRGRGTYLGAAMTACAAAGNGRPFKAACTGRVSIGGLLS